MRINQIKSISYCFLLSILFSSCYYYKPVSIPTPQFKEKGQLNIGGNIGSNLEFNSSYSITNHIGVFANSMTTLDVSKGNESDTPVGNESAEFNIKNYQIEGAVGYFLNFEDRSYHDFYVGYGFGNSGKKYDDFWSFNGINTEGIESQFNVFFIQSSHAFRLSKHFQMVGSFRYNRIFNHSYNYYTADNQLPDRIITQKQFTIPQIGIGFLFDINAAQLSLKVQGSGSEYSDYYSTRPLSVFLGLQLNINEIARRIKETDLN
jgi:hypothetical protein